jgi:hypothetical protein
VCRLVSNYSSNFRTDFPGSEADFSGCVSRDQPCVDAARSDIMQRDLGVSRLAIL